MHEDDLFYLHGHCCVTAALCVLEKNPVHHTHTHTHIYIYIYPAIFLLMNLSAALFFVSSAIFFIDDSLILERKERLI